MRIATIFFIATTLLSPSLAAGHQEGAAAQAAPDPRWTPWLGCWELLDENTRIAEFSPEQVAEGLDTRRSPATNGARVCVNPTDRPAAVTLSTIINRNPIFDETVNADGTDQPIADAECRGTQRTEWSPNGQRLYSKAQISCTGQPPRTIAGLALIGDGPIWIDVQLIESGGIKNIRVRRYRRAFDQSEARVPDRPSAAGIAKQAASARLPFGVDDIKEASKKLPPETIEAVLVELGLKMPLDRKRLIELDDAGVADSIVDLMVALAYPNRFVIDRNQGRGYAGGWSAWGGWPWLFDPLLWPGYYSPFAYSYWGRFDPYYYPPSGFVTIGPGGGGGGGEIQPSGQVRLVDGQGYTRIRARAPEPVNGRSGDWSNSPAGASSNGSGNSGSGGASPSGYSGGGGDGGRTAQPRPPGQ